MADDPAEDVANFTNATSLGTSPTVYPWAAGADYVFPQPVRSVRAASSGNVTFTDLAGASKVAAFLAGETRMIGMKGITNAGTTVTALEGMP